MRSTRRKGVLIEVGGFALPDCETLGFDTIQTSDWARPGFDPLKVGPGAWGWIQAHVGRSRALTAAPDSGRLEKCGIGLRRGPSLAPSGLHRERSAPVAGKQSHCFVGDGDTRRVRKGWMKYTMKRRRRTL